MKLLLSARDPAAAIAINNLANAVHYDNRFKSRIVASPPASDWLRKNTEQTVEVIEFNTASRFEFRKRLRTLIKDYRPDAIIAGSSGPDAGIDEYLVEQGKSLCKTYVIQDFWGDVNSELGVNAHCYLVNDAFAEQVTREKLFAKICIVGSVKHDDYGALDPLALRRDRRKQLLCENNDLLIGYFGMPLAHLEGYWRTIEVFIREVAKLRPKARILFRPHPKERNLDIDNSVSMLKRSGAEVILDTSLSPESSITACDMVVSCYSSCGYDNVLLNRVATAPFNVSVFLLFDPELYQYFREYTGLDAIPFAFERIVTSITNNQGLYDLFNAPRFLPQQSRLQELIPEPGLASTLVLNTVWQHFHEE